MYINTHFRKNKYLFIGLEVEGPLSGKQTLFVSDAVPLENILAAYDLKEGEENYHHIYFGANELSTVDLNTVLDVFKQTDHLITIEVADWNELVDTIICMEPNAHKEAMIDMLLSQRLYIMCCVYKGGKGTLLSNNVNILDTFHVDNPLHDKDTNNLLVKLETDNGVYVSTVHTFSYNSWNAYAGDRTVWQESINTPLCES